MISSITAHRPTDRATGPGKSVRSRLRKEDIGELRHHDGLSPAWPISYEELEPYYTQAETLYHVHGQRGTDPTEPPASGPYAFPPVTHEPLIQELSDNLGRAGYHPLPAPTGIMLNEGDLPHSKCIKCDTCDGFPGLVHAKADAETVCVRPALEHPNVRLVTSAHVIKLEVSATGREVTRVLVQRNGETESYTGSIGAVNPSLTASAMALRVGDHLLEQLR